MKTGIIDEPVNYSKKENDKLGINDYANALKTFIEKTDTPMTVGIQGEWGSGKTSLMNRLWDELEGDEKNTKIECLWVNTWEHSLLKTPEEALISIVNDITNQISLLNPKNTNFDKLKNTGKKIFSGAVKMAAGFTTGMAGKEVVEELLDNKADNSIKELKVTLENFIEETINDKENKDIDQISRLVFYIDDLDRIEPKDAVKILELLKNIFSLPYCVFILAIDYQVVIKGLKDKFGKLTPENEREFRSFFDKIIQLPFVMPVSSYNTGDYVLSLLKEINFIKDEDKIDEETTSQINEIVEYSIGTNPRAIKRLTNNLSLMNILDGLKKNNNNEGSLEYKLLLFFTVCCQVSYPKIYEVLLENSEIKETWNEALAFEITQQKEEEDNNFNNLYEGIKQKEYGNEKWEQCLYRICFADTNLRSNFIQIQSFLSILVDKKIDYENSDDLDNVLKTSSATAVTVKKTTSKRQENFEGTCNYIKDWWLQNKKIDEKILNEKIEILRGIHEIWKEVTENNSDLKISYHNATVGLEYRRQKASYSYGIGGSPKDASMGLNVLKNKDRDYALPKISDDFRANHGLKFNRENKKHLWRYSEHCGFLVNSKNLQKYRNEIKSVVEESANILINGKELLKIDNKKNHSKEDIEKYERWSDDDHTYNVKKIG